MYINVLAHLLVRSHHEITENGKITNHSECDFFDSYFP